MGTLGQQILKPIRTIQNDFLSSCTNSLISFLNLTVLALGKYFLKNYLIKSFQEVTELAAKPYIQCLAESFKVKGISPFTKHHRDIRKMHYGMHFFEFPQKQISIL